MSEDQEVYRKHNELIAIHQYREQDVVDARELHYFLGSKQQFADWIKGRIEKYGFIEIKDYVTFHKIMNREVNGGSRRTEYALTLNMSKELCMVENNEKGRQARRYFIDMEQKAKDGYGLTTPTRKQLAKWVIEGEEEKERLEAINKKLTPKAELMDRVMDRDEMVDVGQASKLLGLAFGRNTLFKQLRERSIFFLNKNEPRQTYVEQGYFVLKEKLIERKFHADKLVLKILVTQKGLAFLGKIFSSNPIQGGLTNIQ